MIRFLRNLFSGNDGALTCDEVMEVLQSYLDGETDTDTARRVAGHLDKCTDCDLESKVYSRIKVSLGSHPETIDPDVLLKLRSFGERVSRGEIG